MCCKLPAYSSSATYTPGRMMMCEVTHAQASSANHAVFHSFTPPHGFGGSEAHIHAAHEMALAHINALMVMLDP